VRDHLQLSPGTLGFVLLAIACGSLLSLPLSGTFITRFGSRRTIVAMALLTGAALAVVAVGYQTDVLVVVAGLFAFGFSAGAWDVAMNVQAAIVERRLQRSIMPRFHAGFSVGTVGGALVGAAMVALGVSVTLHLAVVAAAIAIGVPVAVRAFIPDHHETHTPPGDPVGGESRGAAARRSALSRWTEPRTLLIGLFVLSFAFAEGVGNDWISVAIIDGYATRAVVGTLGFALFLTAMTAGRWFGPYVLNRYEQVVVIRLLALVGIAGVLLFVYSPSTPLAFVGAALWGIGASLGFPLGMTAAAADPAAAAGRVSVVASIGYCAFLIGPPFIGFLGDHITVIRALTTVAGLLTLAAVTASSLRSPASARRATPNA
jgi:predicted MFS family arabinose efflux permease